MGSPPTIPSCMSDPLSAVDDHAEVGTDDAEGVAEVDRDEEGLVDVDVADHDPQGNAHEVDVGDVHDVGASSGVAMGRRARAMAYSWRARLV